MKKNLYILLSSIIALLFSSNGFAQPVFVTGHSTAITVCQNSTADPVNSKLTVTDPHTGTTDTWSLKAAATHGTATVSATATSSGGTLTPTGTTYTPTLGYTGNDSFKVYVSDGTATDSITIYVAVATTPAAITGPSTVCGGFIIVLSDASTPGTWSSANTSIATVSPAGLVTGNMSGGTVNIFYSLSSGCSATKALTVYPTAPTTGTPIMCPGNAAILANGIPGGTWSSGNTAVAMVSGGTVMGMSAGTAVISYSYSNGCVITVVATVNPTPAPASGPPNVCIGGTTTLTDATTGGTWTSDNTAIATIDTFTGFVSGIAVGSANITYQLTSTGCMITLPFTVNQLPNQYGILGGGNYCSADTGVHISLGASDAGTSYFLHVGSSTFGPYSGTGGTLDFGLQKTAGTYTAFATNTSTGCSNIMTGSVGVTITPSVPVSIKITSGVGDTICTGTTVNFNGSALNPGYLAVYQWKVNGVNVGVDAPAYTYVPAPGDVVTMFVATDTICAMADTVVDTYKVNVISRAAPGVTASVSPTIVCKGSSVTITPTPALGGAAPVYYYYSGGVPVGTAPRFAYVPTADSEVIDIALISNYFCRSKDTAFTSVVLRMEEPIVPFFYVDASPEILTAPGQTVTLSVTITNTTGPFTYQWFVNNAIIPGATSDTLVYNSFNYMGNDSVSCEVNRNGACRLSTFNWRKMQNNVGVRRVTGADINIAVSPNPGNGRFQVTGTLATANDEAVTIDITNMVGQVVFSKETIARQGVIDEQVSLHDTTPNGMYLLGIHSATGNKTFHVVVER